MSPLAWAAIAVLLGAGGLYVWAWRAGPPRIGLRDEWWEDTDEEEPPWLP